MGASPSAEEADVQETEDLLDDPSMDDELDAYLQGRNGATHAPPTSWKGFNQVLQSSSESLSRFKPVSLTSSSSSSSITSGGGSTWGLFSQSDSDTSPWKSCGLTRTQRLYGFASCFILGMVCSVLSTFMVSMILIRPVKFALPYTLGALLSLGSTSFLVGPWRQLSSMFDPTRRWATAIYLISLVLTLYFSVVQHSGSLTLAMLIVQCVAFLWYSASYVPYGRTVLFSCFQKTCGCCLGRSSASSSSLNLGG